MNDREKLDDLVAALRAVIENNREGAKASRRMSETCAEEAREGERVAAYLEMQLDGWLAATGHMGDEGVDVFGDWLKGLDWRGNIIVLGGDSGVLRDAGATYLGESAHGEDDWCIRDRGGNLVKLTVVSADSRAESAAGRQACPPVKA